MKAVVCVCNVLTKYGYTLYDELETQFVPVTKLKGIGDGRAPEGKSCCVFVCVSVCVSQAQSDSELDVSCCVFRRGWSVFDV